MGKIFPVRLHFFQWFFNSQPLKKYVFDCINVQKHDLLFCIFRGSKFNCLTACPLPGFFSHIIHIIFGNSTDNYNK